MTKKNVITRTVYSNYERQLFKEVMAGPVPKHIAIIMDGNRRFAEEFLESDINSGHEKGELKLEEILDWCFDLGIEYVTAYAFSTENFDRDPNEVNFIMNMCERSLYKIADMEKTHTEGMRVRVIGDRAMLPEHVNKAADYAEGKTKGYCKFNFNLAIAYGGRQEIICAVKDIARKVRDGEMEIDEISEKIFSGHLYTGDMPDPDLILRTSGEVRMSNFLLWQLAYSELYFTDVYWPGFRFIDLLRAIRTYQQRVRRYGV